MTLTARGAILRTSRPGTPEVLDDRLLQWVIGTPVTTAPQEAAR